MAEPKDMTGPVTRAELREELEKFATRSELREELERALATKADKADLERFATKSELREELEKFATKADLETWGGALLEALRAELARHARTIEDSLSIKATTVDEKYNDLPARVTRLENKVFAPKRRRSR